MRAAPGQLVGHCGDITCANGDILQSGSVWVSFEVAIRAERYGWLASHESPAGLVAICRFERYRPCG